MVVMEMDIDAKVAMGLSPKMITIQRMIPYYATTAFMRTTFTATTAVRWRIKRMPHMCNTSYLVEATTARAAMKLGKKRIKNRVVVVVIHKKV
jgi:hypothetical protein